MPNWVKCRLSMRGLADADLFSTDDEGKKFFDFNKLIPMPQELNMTSGGSEDRAIKAYMTMHGNPALQKMMDARSRFNFTVGDYKISKVEIEEAAKRENMTVEEFVKLGERYCLNVFYYGSTTWYEWCSKNWGTKWNACDSSIEDADTIEFCTAWSAPLPIVAELSRKFPDRVVMIEWADEDMGSNTGQIALRNAEIAVDEAGCTICNNIPNNQTNEAYEIYVKMWGESNCLARDEHGNLYYRGCEGCDGCN